jgi:hypothetical protein
MFIVVCGVRMVNVLAIAKDATKESRASIERLGLECIFSSVGTLIEGHYATSLNGKMT